MLEYRVRYSRIRYSIHPMSFTAERKLPLSRRRHAGAEGSQRHETWIPAPSCCAIPQLDPQIFDEERSFHSATECYGPFRFSSHWQHRFFRESGFEGLQHFNQFLAEAPIGRQSYLTSLTAYAIPTWTHAPPQCLPLDHQ
jgi:hypothetical protein